jgi:hypothetical protein
MKNLFKSLWVNFENGKLKIPLFVFWLILVLFDSNAKGDFEIFIEASKDLFDSKNIYTAFYNQYFHYYYSVLFAVIIYPLTFLPFYCVKVIWMVCNYNFTYRILKNGALFLSLKDESNKIKFTVLFVSFLLVFALWHRNIALAQVTIFVLFLMLESFTLILKNHVLLPALLLAFGIDFKIMPIVCLPYLLHRGYHKVVFTSLILLLVVLLLPSIFIGLDFNLFLLHERWNLVNPNNTEHVLDVAERSFHSITTFLSVLLVENTNEVYALKLKRNLMDISQEELRSVILFVRLLFVLLSFVFLRAKIFKIPPTKLDWWYEWSYIFIVIPLIFPHQQHYAFYMVLPAILYLVNFGRINYFKEKVTLKHREKYIYLAGMFLVFLLLNSHFLLGALREYYDHYKTLTYGVFLVITILALCPPSKIKCAFEN